MFSVRKDLLSFIPPVRYDRDIVTLVKSYDSGMRAYASHSLERAPPGSLLELFSTRGGEISVIRAPEPALKIFHYPDFCSKLESVVRGTPRMHQLDNCLSERDTATASRSQLATAIIDLNLTHLH